MMLRFATVQCYNPSCGRVYDAAVEDGYHAECPICHQMNRVAGNAMSKDITGRCDACGRSLDDHVFGRISYACPPGGKE